MADIIDFTGITYQDIPPDKILQAAIGNLDKVIICGYDKNGDMYLAASDGDTAINIYLLEIGKALLIDTVINN